MSTLVTDDRGVKERVGSEAKDERTQGPPDVLGLGRSRDVRGARSRSLRALLWMPLLRSDHRLHMWGKVRMRLFNLMWDVRCHWLGERQTLF